MPGLRSLVLVLGDQLNLRSSAFDDFDPATDAVWMAEASEEATQVWSARQRIAMFLSSMRHFAVALRQRGFTLHYRELAGSPPADAASDTLAAALRTDLEALQPARLVLTAPGDWRVLKALQAVADEAGVPLLLRDDRSFFTPVREFAAHAGRHHGALRMETFYREQRRRHDILMEPDPHAPGTRQPIGGRWNFDGDNRASFGKHGPPALPPPLRFGPDGITRDVIALVDARFAGHPGTLDDFAWPVTRAQALQALDAFVRDRLPRFGRFQDAMWPGEPWLFHAQLSAALNLGLLDAREVVAAAVAAYQAGTAPLASVEGFVRQILGWREYVRGVYWTQMPGYAALNALDAEEPLPDWYWTGDTDMACLRDAITQTLRFGYAHHIQRLMVTGLYALLLGVRPQLVHGWYLAVYVDAVEWVELPNTLGMSQYADAGLMGSKPYVASGRYIERMGGPCAQCRFDPGQRTGEAACPFTTLYWDFLQRHRTWLSKNERMAAQVRNSDRLNAQERSAIGLRALEIRSHHGAPPARGNAAQDAPGTGRTAARCDSDEPPPREPDLFD